jgi:hypothetical protein
MGELEQVDFAGLLFDLIDVDAKLPDPWLIRLMKAPDTHSIFILY